MGYIEKLNKTLDTKSRLKNSINYLGGSITDDTVFRDYIEDFDEIYDLLPKGEDIGNELTPTNIKGGKVNIEPMGNTSQESTQGYQLFAYPYYENTVARDGITFTVKFDGTIHVQGTATAKTSFTLRNRDLFLNINEGDTYTLVASGLGVVDSTVWLDMAGQTDNFLDKWLLQSSSNHATAVAQSKDKKPLIKITVENGAIINTDIKILLYKGSYDSSKEYEPYTGEIPSPNPDYPQDIKVVTGNNSVNIKGKNLFNPTIEWDNESGVSCTINNQYITWNGTSSAGVAIYIANINMPLGTYTLTLETISGTHTTGKQIWMDFYNGGTKVTNQAWTTDKAVTKTFSRNINKINIGWDTNDTFNNYTFRIQIESGSTPTSYEQYSNKTSSVNLDTIELYKIGDYQDIIFKNEPNNKYYNSSLIEDGWYKKQKIKEIIFNGTENWNNDYTAFGLTNLDKSITASGGICNYYLYNNRNSGMATLPNNYFAVQSLNGSATSGIYIQNSSFSTAEAFKSDLAQKYTNGNPVCIYYPLETPLDTQITDTTLINQLEELYIQNILDDYIISTESDGGNAQLIVKVTGIKK